MDDNYCRRTLDNYCTRTGRSCIDGAYDGGDGWSIDCVAGDPIECEHLETPTDPNGPVRRLLTKDAAYKRHPGGDVWAEQIPRNRLNRFFAEHPSATHVVEVDGGDWDYCFEPFK